MTDELDASFTKLLENLNNSSHKLRSEAAIELGKLGDARAVKHLIEALNYRNLYFWQKVVEALERIGEKAVLPLIEVLKNNTRRDVKHFAVVHLGRSADVRDTTTY